MQIRPYQCTCKMYIFAQSEKLTSSFKTLVTEKSKEKKVSTIENSRNN